MVATTTAREDNMYIAEESTLAIQPVYCLFLLLSYCCLCAMCRMERRKLKVYVPQERGAEEVRTETDA